MLVCANPSTATGAHDSGCSEFQRVRALWGPYEESLSALATRHPHARVTGALMLHGDFHFGPVDRFEHVAGGGLCRFCKVGRGPMVKSIDGPVFACPSCYALRGYRPMHEKAEVMEFGVLIA
ncbi:hypothetical protein [Nocardia terpenica]|uniref:hypothetical protein n=1 Tax=Nocardia terpenica TaxID=455432 RepID=UPI0012E94DF6|nr:hypothetical protein [Nocardia terpenica]